MFGVLATTRPMNRCTSHKHIHPKAQGQWCVAGLWCVIRVDQGSNRHAAWPVWASTLKKKIKCRHKVTLKRAVWNNVCPGLHSMRPGGRGVIKIWLPQHCTLFYVGGGGNQFYLGIKLFLPPIKPLSWFGLYERPQLFPCFTGNLISQILHTRPAEKSSHDSNTANTA